MASLFGASHARAELLRRVGDASQLGGIRPGVLEGGRSASTHVLDVVNGSGLAFTVLADRCLDLGAASFRGASLCWHAPAGVVHPAYYEPEDSGWLGSFFGGLLTTCGLSQVGDPAVDQGERLGLHGRIANTPAEEVRWGSTWVEDELTLWIEGVVREARLFGPNLALRRRISTPLGGLTVRIENQVENVGFTPSPLMVLFHFNVGYPLLDEGAELLVGSDAVQPRDAVARAGLEEWSRIPAPQPGWPGQVFYHTPSPLADGRCAALLVNRRFDGGRGLGLAIRWQHEQLPHLVEWKMVAEGAYVLWIEPANCLVEGRAAERAAGRLEFIEPGETREFALEVQILPDHASIDAMVEQFRPGSTHAPA